MKLLSRIAIGLVALSAALTTHAQLLNFDFSFQNTIGTVGGTVTGEILGLTDNSTGPAARVLIETFPAQLNSIAGSIPIDATTWDQQFANSFTVLDGQVVDGGFWAQQTVDGFSQGFQLYLNGEPFNFINLDGTDDLFVWGDSGLPAANIVPDGGTVPDSTSAFSLLGMAIVGLGTLRRKFVA